MCFFLRPPKIYRPTFAGKNKAEKTTQSIHNTYKRFQYYKLVYVPLNPEGIDRFHQTGSLYVDKNTGKTCKSIIVKYNSYQS